MKILNTKSLHNFFKTGKFASKYSRIKFIFFLQEESNLAVIAQDGIFRFEVTYSDCALPMLNEEKYAIDIDSFGILLADAKKRKLEYIDIPDNKFIPSTYSDEYKCSFDNAEFVQQYSGFGNVSPEITNFPSDDETRYFMQSMCIDGKKLVATDGRRMFVSGEVLETENTNIEPFIMPSPLKHEICNIKTFQIAGNSEKYIAHAELNDNIHFYGYCVKGQFPNYKRVLDSFPAEQYCTRVSALHNFHEIEAIIKLNKKENGNTMIINIETGDCFAYDSRFNDDEKYIKLNYTYLKELPETMLDNGFLFGRNMLKFVDGDDIVLCTTMLKN